MTQTADSPVADLRSRMRGDVVGREDPAYDDSRRVWNAAIDRHPLLVARCADEADVQAVVRFAGEQRHPVSVRGGAHSMSGASVVEDGIVIDVSRINRVHVDPEARRAVVGGGALLRDLDAATQAFGLATPAGLVSHTGVGSPRRSRTAGSPLRDPLRDDGEIGELGRTRQGLGHQFLGGLLSF